MILRGHGGQPHLRTVQTASDTDDPDRSRPPRFTAVYRDHAAYVWRVGRALGVSTLHIDDVVHDVFLVVRRRLPDFDPRRSLRAWLAGITRRVVGHLRRKRAREARRLHALPDPQPARSPHDVVQDKDAARHMEHFLDYLDPDKRVAFVLMEIEGLTAREVAEVCRTNPRTIYSRVRAAKSRFARFVEEVAQP
jgi:RNA polymerase sigma-70 factor (ECF subfamily)